MPLSLSCSCGARLEVDDKFAGREINCPDCQRLLRGPDSHRGGQHTSGLALGSLLFAIIGAFTVIGTLIAVVCGLLALRSIARQPERLAGLNIAWAGIILGGFFTGLTLLAHLGMEWFGLDRWLREPEWAGKLAHDGPLQVRQEKGRFSLIRPSPRWGVSLAKTDKNAPGDLIMVDVADDAQAIGLMHLLQRAEEMDFCRDLAVQKIRDSELVRQLNRSPVSSTAGQIVSHKTIAAAEGQEKEEVLLDISLGGRDRLFLLHVIKAKDNLYVVAGGTRKNRFPRLEGEIRKLLESFQLEP